MDRKGQTLGTGARRRGRHGTGRMRARMAETGTMVVGWPRRREDEDGDDQEDCVRDDENGEDEGGMENGKTWRAPGK